MKRFEVILYEDTRGSCPIADWLRDLDREDSKSSRLLLRKVYFQIERLENEGLFVGEPMIKRISTDIWELRPIPYRILFITLSDHRFLLLHSFRKSTRATPKREIEKARNEFDLWLKRGESR